MAQEKTNSAFATFRAGRSLQPINPDAPRYKDDADQMSAEDGLLHWTDGDAPASQPRGDTPTVEQKPSNVRLWVVGKDDVVHAAAKCSFGDVREARAAKHSNLTGGADAYVGGELILLDDQTLVLNGCSGRYRVRTEDEMRSVAKAFKKSGYNAWSMGWNLDTNRPAMFGTQDPD